MKYPQLVSTPAVVKEWLEAELECLGIDSAAYARTVLSLLSRDTIDPAEVIQSGYVLVANKGGRGAGGLGGPHPPRTREEELKRAEVIECLRSASEDHGGIQLLVDQLISMLKQLPAASEPGADTATDSSRRPATGESPPPDDPVLRYEAAFPALSRESPGVVPLTYFSKMGRTAAAGLWHTAAWPASLDHLRLLLPPPAYTAPLEPPPKPPETTDTARVIRPSAETHFQPIRRPSGDDGGPDWPPATYDARLYTRSESGGLYLEDEGPRPAAEPPQKYMTFRERWPPPGAPRGLTPKFKLRINNEKYCQTDEPAADGAGRDLLQILVSGEQAGEVRGMAVDEADADDDDSSYEVLSSLQQTLHSIYEDGSEPELESDRPAGPRHRSLSPARTPSAFARVCRRSSGHRPLYLRGGGADSLLAAVYTGGGWPAAAGPESADHRPLYARQPAGGGPAEFAEHRQLTSGRISDTVYGQGPTEYPALRYQLAGRDLPEVTFCRLSGDTHRSGPLKEDSAAADSVTAWESSSDAVRSSREPSVGSDAAASTLWQAAGDRDRSADRALWEARADPSRRRSSVDSAVWEQELWEAPRSLLESEGAPEPGGTLWETPSGQQEDSSKPAALWETQRSLVDPEGTSESGTLWEAPRGQPEGASEPAALWETPHSQTEPDGAPEPGGTLWKAPGSLVEPEGAQEPGGTLWKAPGSLVEPDDAPEPGGTLWKAPGSLVEPEGAQEIISWESRLNRSERESSVEMTIWETSGEQAERTDTSTANIWASDAAPAPRDTSIDALWASRELSQRDQSIDDTRWEFTSELLQPERSADEPADTLWEVRVDLTLRRNSAERSLWESPAEVPRRDGWESPDELTPRHDISAERSLWRQTGDQRQEQRPWRATGELPRQVSADAAPWPADPPLWEAERSDGWASWDDALLRAPEHIWRRAESTEKAEWSTAEPTDKPRWRAAEPTDMADWSIAEPTDRPEWSIAESTDKPEWSAAEPTDKPGWSTAEPTDKPGWSTAPTAADKPEWSIAESTDKSEWSIAESTDKHEWSAEPTDKAGWSIAQTAVDKPEWSAAQRSAGGEGEEQARRLLWRLGGDAVLAQTGLCPADFTDSGRRWEFIEENNVQNKIDASLVPEGGLAERAGWRVLPALRQLSESLGLTEGPPLPDGVAINAWALEEQWRRAEGPHRPARDRRVRRSDRKRPCSYFMEGNCKRNDCKFSHDLSAITCVFWEESACFKGVHCPFLHGYPADDEEDEDSSDSAKRAVPKKSFKLEKEDFPSLHNTKKWHRNDEEDSRKAGRRNCRRHKSFSDASLGVGGGEPELPRPVIGGRGKRRRHHSKSEGVRPTDTGARRP